MRSTLLRLMFQFPFCGMFSTVRFDAVALFHCVQRAEPVWKMLADKISFFLFDWPMRESTASKCLLCIIVTDMLKASMCHIIGSVWRLRLGSVLKKKLIQSLPILTWTPQDVLKTKSKSS